jgi:hypothetical protein
MEEDYEIEYSTNEFRVSRETLADAVAPLGTAHRRSPIPQYEALMQRRHKATEWPASVSGLAI